MNQLKTFFGLPALLLLSVGCSGDGKVLSREEASSGGNGSTVGGAGGGISGGGGSATSGSGGTTGNGTGGVITIGSGGTVLTLDCNPPCTNGQVCSPGLRCVDPGTCLTDADCFLGQVCTAGVCEAGGQCGAAEFKLTENAPNVLILSDRSCSMSYCATGSTKGQTCRSGPSKFDWSVSAMVGLTTAFSGRVRWGLELFPDITGADCTQDPPSISPALGTESAIQSLLVSAQNPTDPWFPDGPCVTPIMATFQQVETLAELRDPQRANYVLLVSDGDEHNCGTIATNNTVTEQTIGNLAVAGIKTYIIGFFTGASTYPDVLNRWAVAGGAPNPDPASDYYPATDLTTLQAAMEGIIFNLVGCDFQLDTQPASPDIYVFINNFSVERNSPDGWSYNPDSNVVSFLGASCNTVRAGGVDIDVVFGCNQPSPN
ncbi:MAG TPA: hypothetical protein VGJ84_14690 [Polyangiaceae bacterium]|jgi:hypothetical protein